MRASIRDQILNVAGALFYKEGIRAVGVDRIIEEASVAKATLYRHFPSKEHLVAAYLSERHERVLQSLEDVLVDIPEPRHQLRIIFERLHEKADSPEFRGCAFALAVAEHGESERVVSIAREHKRSVRDIFARILAAAGISEAAPVAHLALLYEGALATVAVNRNPTQVLAAKDAALDVFDWSFRQANGNN
ncbi:MULTISPECIES: TetR/AcrR family transcriptional regulator [Brucella]|uniref:Transcriptional regulator, TetR family n=1 Tax=Ochrobactrum soli TaxID=2448455 RepID=A0A2P9HDR5_9HYPH|nr:MULTISPECIES: TetR/AcrR family transcriptional regulator [Brucella]MDX4075391.1 TetR/AcrR family transcriptional regulator [Brucella sp. NBRC 113783]SPL62213.1 Transcriptional regulator, TetR family [[Ochrobactrum] soli]